MKVISIHLPEPIVQIIDKLIENGIFHSRSEAIRLIIISSISKYSAFVTSNSYMSTVSKFSINPPTSNKTIKKSTELISFKAPYHILELIDTSMKLLGLSSKSEVIRLALLFYFNNFVLPIVFNSEKSS